MNKIGSGIFKFSLPFLALILFLGTATVGIAQSTSIDFPTPVVANEVSGTIVARDIGDSRLTRHFYQLSGTTGDLNFKIEYLNLNGDIDVFTADTMRPLAKVSLVASDNSISIDRTVFLRLQEKLIIRVEARSANDDPGLYRIGFSGTFVASTETVETPDAPTVSAAATKGRRVTSSGAIIPEPPVAKVEPPPTPPAETKPVAQPKPKTPGRTTTTSSTKTTASGKTTRPTTTPRKPVTKTPAKTTPSKPAETTARSTKPAGSTTKKTVPSAPKVPAAPPTPDPMANARLIVETRDGMHREHFLRDVKRFTVEKGQLVVILKSGKTELEPMSNVLKVTIEP